MNEDPLVPRQPVDKKPIASMRYLLWGLAAFIALITVIQFGRGTPETTTTQAKKDKPNSATSEQVTNFQKQQAQQAERLKAEAAAADARTAELQRAMAAYGSGQGDAAGVPPPTAEQQRVMAGGVAGQPSQASGGSPEKTPRQKAEEERVALVKSSQESSTVAIDFSDQLLKPAAVAKDPMTDREAVASVAEDEERGKLTDAPKIAARSFKVLEGTLLEGVLTNRLTGAFTGPVNVMLTTPVYSHDHGTLLLPQGTRILGSVSGVRGQSDERLFVAFHRAILPTGFSVSLDQYLGLAQQGQTGLRDKVDHHYFQIFGASVALSAIEGLGQATGNIGNGGATVRLQSGISTGTANGSTRIIDQMLQRLPTFTVRERTRVKIYISKDLSIGAYDPAFKLDPL